MPLLLPTAGATTAAADTLPSPPAGAVNLPAVPTVTAVTNAVTPARPRRRWRCDQRRGGRGGGGARVGEPQRRGHHLIVRQQATPARPAVRGRRGGGRMRRCRRRCRRRPVDSSPSPVVAVLGRGWGYGGCVLEGSRRRGRGHRLRRPFTYNHATRNRRGLRKAPLQPRNRPPEEGIYCSGDPRLQHLPDEPVHQLAAVPCLTALAHVNQLALLGEAPLW